MWSDAWRRNGKLWLQKTSGYIFNFPNHDRYLRTTEQKFHAFIFQFILNTQKLIIKRTPKFGIITDKVNWYNDYGEYNEGLKNEHKSRVMYIPSIATIDLGHTYYIFVQLFQAVLVLNENG